MESQSMVCDKHVSINRLDIKKKLFDSVKKRIPALKSRENLIYQEIVNIAKDKEFFEIEEIPFKLNGWSFKTDKVEVGEVVKLLVEKNILSVDGIRYTFHSNVEKAYFKELQQ